MTYYFFCSILRFNLRTAIRPARPQRHVHPHCEAICSFNGVIQNSHPLWRKVINGVFFFPLNSIYGGDFYTTNTCFTQGYQIVLDSSTIHCASHPPPACPWFLRFCNFWPLACLLSKDSTPNKERQNHTIIS